MSIDNQLAAEAAAYAAEKGETDEAYAALFERFNYDVAPGIPSTGKRTAFVVPAANFLAHIQMMMGVLRPQDLVVVLMGDAEGFRNLMPCKVICLPQTPFTHRFEAMRESLKANDVGTLVWVSVPIYAKYAFALRLAEKQVYWSLRFHPFWIGDLNITQGQRGEKTRHFHGHDWTCVHAPMNVTINPVDKLRCEAMRAPYEYLYGTLAREEKLLPEYLSTVCDILHAHPEAGFVWTGRKEPPHIRKFFRDRGLSNRHRFVGWQDPDEFPNTIDCFLETFPLGGLTTLNALGHGCPVVAMKQLHSPLGAVDASQGLLAASGRDEYVAMALSVRDRRERAKAVEAGYRVLRAEQAQAERDRAHFWKVIHS